MQIEFKLLIIFTFLFTWLPRAQAIKNLSQAKAEVQNYYESGRYEIELQRVIDSALVKLRSIKRTPGDIVVFDVDETLLSNYEEIKALDFGYRSDIWDEWILSAKAPPIKPVLRFFDSVLARGVKAAFITGRDTRHLEATVRNLYAAGYKNYDTLIVRAPNQKSMKMALFKEQCRIGLINRGYRIIMCVGDQETDLQGSAVGIPVKLPDLLYLIE